MSLLGDQLYRVGLTWYTTEQGGPFDAAAFGMATALPLAVIGLFGGVIVDRTDRLKVMVATDLVRCAVMVAFTVAIAVAAPGIVGVVVGAVALAVPGVLFVPALQTTIPRLAGGDHDRLVRMDAWMLGTFGVTNVLGPALGGLLIGVAPLAWIFGLDAASFAFSAVMILAVRRALPLEPPRPRAAVPGGDDRSVLARRLGEAREGLRFLFSHPTLRPQFVVYPVLDAVQFSVVFLLPAYLDERFGSSGSRFGLVLGVYSLGRVLAMALVARTGLKQRRGVVFASNFVVQGVAMAAFVAAPSLWLALVAIAVAGAPGGATSVCLSSFIQVEAPPEVRGRVFAAVTSMTTWLMPVMPLVLGTVASERSATAAFVVVAACYLTGGVYLAAHRSVREAR